MKAPDYTYYSWEDNFSTDPKWYDLRYKTVRIRCNGIRLSHALCCLTGSGGFVKSQKLDSRGEKVWSELGFKGAPVVQYVVGDIEVTWEEEQDG